MRGIFGQSGLLRRFSTDRSGNFALLTGAALSMLALGIGYGVNIAQVYNVRANLVQALDTALISTGRDISTGLIPENKAEESIQTFLQANEGATLSQGDNFHLQLPIAINRAARTINATAYVDVDVFFPLFGQSNKVRVSTSAATLYSDTVVEVGLMLDVTGSMGEKGSRLDGKPQTKLQNLQTAAQQAVDNLLSRNQPGIDPRVRVAIIPYSQGVNAGTLADGNYVEYTPKSSGGLLGGLLDIVNNLLGQLGLKEIGAVTTGLGLTQPDEPERPIGLTALSNPPAHLNTAQRDKIKKYKTALETTRQIEKDGCTTERKIKFPGAKDAVFDPSEDSPNEAMVNRDKRLKGACPTAAVVPLTADAAKLKQAIRDLKASGGTAGHIGIQWTRYLLSPRWGDFLSSHVRASRPAEYNGRVRKVAILMTDGEFNAAYVGVPEGSSTSSGQASRSGDYAKTLCSEMKEDNVEVFTIGFMLDSGKDILKQCATPDTGELKHFYDASNAEELRKAFEEITENTEKLQLTN